nr:MAG TPA: hypothetical protein [Caudoviricetes sp.]
MISYAPSRPSSKKWWVREKDRSRDFRNIAKYAESRRSRINEWEYFTNQINYLMNNRTRNREEVDMLLTKYKLQDMIEKVELDINDVMHGLEKSDEAQEWDDSHAFVAGYVEQLVKDAIIDQLGRM